MVDEDVSPEGEFAREERWLFIRQALIVLVLFALLGTDALLCGGGM